MLPKENPPAVSDAQQTIEYLTQNSQLWMSEDGTAYITFFNRMYQGLPGPRWETYQLDSSEFHGILQAVHGHLNKEGLPKAARTDLILKLQGDAALSGTYDRLWIRSAWERVDHRKRNVCIDLGNHSREIVRISHDLEQPTQVLNDMTPKFRRSPSTKPMVRPVGEAYAQHGWELFCDLFGFEDLDSMRLIYAWMMYALWPEGPYPVLALIGPPDSGKSTILRVIRRLIDPQTPESTGLPISERDLVLTASQSRLLALDNLSYLPPWASDALCRVSTGTGGHTRRQYTDTEQLHLGGCCATVLTGVNQIIKAPDLLSRAIVIELPQIKDRDRISEMNFWKRFDRISAEILGNLIQGIRAYLGNLHCEFPMEFEFRPRMQGFADMAMVAETVFGWESGSFERAYRANIVRSESALIDEKPAIQALIRLAHNGFSGTLPELLTALEPLGTRQDRESVHWPQNTVVLGRLLTEAEPFLAKRGYEIERLRIGRFKTRHVTLVSRPKTS